MPDQLPKSKDQRCPICHVARRPVFTKKGKVRYVPGACATNCPERRYFDMPDADPPHVHDWAVKCLEGRNGEDLLIQCATGDCPTGAGWVAANKLPVEGPPGVKLPPADALWLSRPEFHTLLRGWLRDSDGVRYANELIDTAHRSWSDA